MASIVPDTVSPQPRVPTCIGPHPVVSWPQSTLKLKLPAAPAHELTCTKAGCPPLLPPPLPLLLAGAGGMRTSKSVDAVVAIWQPYASSLCASGPPRLACASGQPTRTSTMVSTSVPALHVSTWRTEPAGTSSAYVREVSGPSVLTIELPQRSVCASTCALHSAPTAAGAAGASGGRDGALSALAGSQPLSVSANSPEPPPKPRTRTKYSTPPGIDGSTAFHDESPDEHWPSSFDM